MEDFIMFLYLVQHGEAKSKETDPSRGLSDKGFEDIGKVADYACKLNINVDLICHSGKTRAFQTAEVLGKSIKPENGSSEQNGLAPMDDPEIWLNRLSGIGENTMLVGHLPHLSKLAALLLCGDMDKTIINFKNACIVCLNRHDKGGWSLAWMITPDIIN